ncbi:hypothetical protein K461DRAFT_319114 [Myriangium duriaei CBS 260.36]|uniref:Low temperature requirement A n=1 Tax=Myriangium duriaei CBS 260.36 TaxID=1168546 RepID=A0A9P4MIR5_9PEZI|nr:hypothetical protein K461DRAFT_319114 [Myriangium duriaei CBS 260.36]
MANHLPYFNDSAERQHPSEHYHKRESSFSRGRRHSPNKPEEFPEAKQIRSISPDPLFDRHTEATNIELFYDLFFVANLTVFSSVKEVNDGRTLSQYIGFFCILWFTWYQVSLYDVRFAKDTVFDRMAKVVQFGVMVGFAVCGPTFNAGEKKDNLADGLIGVIADPGLKTFKSLTLLMMVSRLALITQYLQAMWISRKVPANVFPISLIIGIYLVSAGVYGLLFIAFARGHSNAYITWYVVAFLETIICTAVSTVWRNISFKGTHLVQRMGLLTLIILGEGVMGLAHNCQNLVKAQIFSFSGSTISDIACTILLIYFLYMIYFDWIQEHHMGSIRQQIWSFLHFPLHLALVLTLSGANQFVGWRAGTSVTNKLQNEFNDLIARTANASADTATYILDTANYTCNGIVSGAYEGAHNFGQFVAYTKASTTVQKGLDVIKQAINGTDHKSIDQNSAEEGLAVVYSTAINTVFNAIGFEPPHAADHAYESILHPSPEDNPLEDAIEELDGMSKISRLIFTYFFVTIGSYVIITGIIAWIGKRDKNLTDKIRLGVRFVFGGLLAIIAFFSIHDTYENFADSPWILPTATLVLLMVAIITNAPLPKGKGYHHAKSKIDDIDQ